MPARFPPGEENFALRDGHRVGKDRPGKRSRPGPITRGEGPPRPPSNPVHASEYRIARKPTPGMFSNPRISPFCHTERHEVSAVAAK